ncbi:hypothetical protein PHLCEN_2v1572 [Hermanssonia centrifuga]|uniref:Uncharacterized protein n=1 Tax=Hermanssonia centrifuga TaxID=98765 RepID=A0A2R6RZI7_9APHY|nr:hypothetical protein PHLCEN_2v1572 [Hermanssonia centrifuga]
MYPRYIYTLFAGYLSSTRQSGQTDHTAHISQLRESAHPGGPQVGGCAGLNLQFGESHLIYMIRQIGQLMCCLIAVMGTLETYSEEHVIKEINIPELFHVGTCRRKLVRKNSHEVSLGFHPPREVVSDSIKRREGERSRVVRRHSLAVSAHRMTEV